MNSALSICLDMAPFSSNDVRPIPNITMGLFYDFTDVASMLLNGSGINEINDKSGNNKHATQSVISQQPVLTNNVINGNSIGRFTDPNNRKLNFDGSFLSSTNYLIVMAFSCFGSGISSGTILGGSNPAANANLTVVRTTSTLFYSQYVNDHTWNTTTNSGSFEIISILNSSTSGKTGHQNGSLIGSNGNTTLLSSWNGAAIGHRSDADWRFSGDMAYFAVCVGVEANSTNREYLEGWMAWKLGLQSALPVGHPYKSFAP